MCNFIVRVHDQSVPIRANCNERVILMFIFVAYDALSLLSRAPRSIMQNWFRQFVVPDIASRLDLVSQIRNSEFFGWDYLHWMPGPTESKYNITRLSLRSSSINQEKAESGPYKRL